MDTENGEAEAPDITEEARLGCLNLPLQLKRGEKKAEEARIRSATPKDVEKGGKDAEMKISLGKKKCTRHPRKARKPSNGTEEQSAPDEGVKRWLHFATANEQ
ncbi:hypothetical protein MBLNU230_g7784t1 [Neophaeotheca triangularis]